MVNGEQITVQFHVDDLKVLYKDHAVLGDFLDDLRSDKDHAVLDDFLDDLRSKFGQEDKLAENKGLVHEYLGITIDYLIVGKVVFTMFDYLEDMIFETANDLKDSCSYYSGNDQLFKVDHDSPRLSQKEAGIFHCHVARLLFSSKRARPDIQVWVAFLCTRVKSPMEQDYKKFKRVIGYLEKTVHMPLVIGVDNSGPLTWNSDVLLVVHLDCKSHTGSYLTLGHGSV